MSDKKGKGAKKSAQTNKQSNSLVKTIVLEDLGKWIQPQAKQKFYIDEDANFPDITFEIETQESPPYTWSYQISWPAAVSGLKESSKRGKTLKTFKKEKITFQQNEKQWKVDIGEVIGGTLTVEVKTAKEKFKRSIYILGKNPEKAKVIAFLNTIEDVKGFEKIIQQETKFKNFINADSLPVVAFDGGYGMTQMTNPAPTYEQIWSWKKNIEAGTSLYKTKQKLAKQYLGQKNRAYSEEQLKLETWSRWNGGSYHTWNEKAKSWERNPTMLCDSKNRQYWLEHE